jgi:RNA polymerase sigma-70 factor (ECF subfamily)
MTRRRACSIVRRRAKVAEGFLVQLASQDRSTWDRELVATGFHYLERSAAGRELGAFHLEAAIASLHSGAETYERTDWARIAELASYPFFPAAQGEFHRLAGRADAARVCFERALQLARNPAEAELLERKLELCGDDRDAGASPRRRPLAGR